MYDEFGRALTRLEAAREIIRVGQLSGAVGTHAHIDPFVEKYVCTKLGLKPAAISTQVLQRDRHAEYMSALALVGASTSPVIQDLAGKLVRFEVKAGSYTLVETTLAEAEKFCKLVYLKKE